MMKLQEGKKKKEKILLMRVGLAGFVRQFYVREEETHTTNADFSTRSKIAKV